MVARPAVPVPGTWLPGCCVLLSLVWCKVSPIAWSLFSHANACLHPGTCFEDYCQGVHRLCVSGREPMRVLTKHVGSSALRSEWRVFLEEGHCSTGFCLFSSPHTLAWSLWSALNLLLNLGCVTGKEIVRDSNIRKFNPTLSSLRQTLDYTTKKNLRTSQRNKLSMFRVKARGSVHFTSRHDRQMVSKSICTWDMDLGSQ